MAKKEESHLFDLLVEQDRVQLRKFASHLLQPDPERTLILNAHLIVEHLLEGIISTSMKSPEAWLQEAPFASKLNLAIALGLIGEHEIACCKVLNSARNKIAHGLQPLPKKWRVELERLAYGKGSGLEWKKNVSRDLNQVLRVLCAYVGSCWLRARADVNLGALKEKHIERWRELLKEKMRGKYHLIDIDKRNEHEAHIVSEVSLALLRELKQEVEKEKTKTKIGNE